MASKQKIAFISDVQLHNHKLWSHPLPNGMNSRLKNGIDALEQAFKAVGSGDMVVINGDLFHDRKRIEHDVLQATTELFEKYKDREVILVVGNHDQFLRNGRIHATSIFNAFSNVTVVSDWHIHYTDNSSGDGVALFCHAFTEDIPSLRKWVRSHAKPQDGLRNFLILHQGVEGADYGNGIKSKSELDLKDIKAGQFDYVILGHYHKPQSLSDNTFYLGSPYEIDEGEAGDIKRFMLFDGDKLKSIDVTGMPKHRRFQSNEDYQESLSSGDVTKDDFVTVVCDSRDEVREVSNSGLKAVKRRVVTHTTAGLEVEDMSVDSALKACLEKLGRPDLLDLALSRLAE
jgi:DNA repair exonuclease SbcCD nuclease subunit